MPVDQALKFTTNCKHSHDNEVKRKSEYLKGTNDEGLILKPDLKKGLETHSDSNFVGSSDKDYSEDPSIFHSRTGFIIKHSNFPMTWKSKLQT